MMAKSRQNILAPMPSESQRRANQKQDATRKRVALWLEPEDAKALARIQRKHKLPSRIAALRWLLKPAPASRDEAELISKEK